MIRRRFARLMLVLVASPSLLVAAATAAAADDPPAAATPAMTYPLCAQLKLSGAVNFDTGQQCIGGFSATLCFHQTLTGSETITVLVCIPEGLS